MNELSPETNDAKTSMVKKRLLPLVVIVLAIVVAFLLMKNPPIANKKPLKRPELLVNTLTLKKQNHTVQVSSFGTVSPRTQGALVAQVSGIITQLGSNKGTQFQAGDFFEKGELLLTIDVRDYQLTVDIAKAALTEARLRLSEEKARVSQAKKDWKRLGKSGQPNNLVLRKPQLASAKAAIQSAKASLSKAKLNLERTKIKAPYSGRILEKKVDLGQFVNPGTALATIFATEVMEVRLPLNALQQRLIQLPEHSRNDARPHHRPKVRFISTGQFGHKNQTWQGEIVRTEAALDKNTRQLYVIAELEAPFRHTSQPSLKIGQFMQAQIEGIQLKNVFKIPRATLYSDHHVLLLKDGKLLRRSVSVAWSEPDYYLIDDGLNDGDQLITTPLNNAVSGTLAKSQD